MLVVCVVKSNNLAEVDWVCNLFSKSHFYYSLTNPTDFNKDHVEVKFDSVKKGTRTFLRGKW